MLMNSLRHLGVVLLLGLSGASAPPISVQVRPYHVFPGGDIQIRIHVVYHDSDRWMALDWQPDTVGNSSWSVRPTDHSTWTLWRRISQPGVYAVRASVGSGETMRASAFQRITVLE